jgi:hypothetical protein
MKRLLPVLLIGLAATAAPAWANSSRDAILSGLKAEAAKAEPGFPGFSAERGKVLFETNYAKGKPETPACVTCHVSPSATGKTKAGKDIQPMAVSKNASRYTDPAEVEKWFGRNCNQVLGRDCTPKEKGDFLTFMMSQ